VSLCVFRAPLQFKENHPKISALETKIDMLEVDRNLKNALLPKVDLSTPIYQNHSTSTATNLKIIKLVLIFLPYISKKEVV
jgi:hypothetical protein